MAAGNHLCLAGEHLHILATKEPDISLRSHLCTTNYNIIGVDLNILIILVYSWTKVPYSS